MACKERGTIMAWVAVDADGRECVLEKMPYRPIGSSWEVYFDLVGNPGGYVLLPTGSIRKLIGRKLTWEDEPVEIS